MVLQGSNCYVLSTTVTCVSPSFLSTTLALTNISYNIRVGYALGPHQISEALTLSAVPDPVFATDGSAIMGNSEHVIGSGAPLMIEVSSY